MAEKKETRDDKKKRARKIIRALRRLYPDADTALNHRNPLQLLISTILSAQSTDENVNKVTPVLFKKYRSAKSLASAPREEVEKVVFTTGFYRQKAKNIQGTCRKIIDDFGGKVPDNMADLTTLPGVARKTANVVLGSAFGKTEGVVVDTHVGRLATRLGLTWSSKDSKDAVKIEKDLIEIIPKNDWIFIGHALVWHGRKVCDARKPDCPNCTLAKHCPSSPLAKGG